MFLKKQHKQYPNNKLNINHTKSLTTIILILQKLKINKNVKQLNINK